MFNTPSTHSAKSRRWILSRQKCFQHSLCCLLQIIHTTDVEFSHPESYASLILSIWQTDLKHADSMMPFALPVIANLQQKWVTSSEIWWSCPILCCGSVPKWWVSAFTDSEKKITGAFGCSDVNAPLNYSTVLEGQSWSPFLMVVATYINAHLHEVRLCLLLNFFKCTFITLNFLLLPWHMEVMANLTSVFWPTKSILSN